VLSGTGSVREHVQRLGRRIDNRLRFSERSHAHRQVGPRSLFPGPAHPPVPRR
jgi:hypothetical protein